MNYEAILAEKDAAIDHIQKRFEELQEKHIGLQQDNIEVLRDNLELRKTLSAQYQSHIDLQQDYAQLRHELEQLKKMIFGSKRERFVTELNSNQLSLFATEEVDAPVEHTEAKEHIEYDRKAPKKHNGRNELPDHLPVHEVIIEPTEDITGMTRIGEEITETLEYTSASLVKKRVIRPKYARKNGEGIVIAQLPSRTLPKAIAESSLLTHIIISKFVDHMPFYRQIQRFKRDYNWEVSDSTINEWFIACCTLLQPLYEKLKEKVMSSGYIQADESPIKVLDQDKPGSTHQGYQWVYHSPESGLVLFTYRKGRGEHGPKEILSSYQGILQCDGYAVYDKIGMRPGVQLAGCLAHARRKYDEAKTNDKIRSEYALNLIQQIYGLERNRQALSIDERTQYRQEHIGPLFNALQDWAEKESLHVVPKSPIGKAISYTLLQWDKLKTILTDGRIKLDNNLIENKIRPLALGRKNYLFAGSHDAAQRIAMMYSFVGSCKAHDINPSEWLKDTLDKIAETKMSDLESLLPSGKM